MARLGQGTQFAGFELQAVQHTVSTSCGQQEVGAGALLGSRSQL